MRQMKEEECDIRLYLPLLAMKMEEGENEARNATASRS